MKETTINAKASSSHSNNVSSMNYTNFLPVPEDETILKVSIYDFQRAKKKQEFLVLGSHFLTTLCNKISCDRVGYQGVVPNYFYIDGVCYCDEVDERSKSHLPNRVQFRPMRGTRFLDTNPVQGSHCLYAHGNNCQHILVFNDRRPLGMKDEQDYSQYPLETYHRE